MSYEFYISPAEYQQAEANGISPNTLIRRIRHFAWRKERALTTPPRQRKNLREWSAIAKSNGINYRAFQRRMERNWSIEIAATKPLADRKALMLKNAQGNRTYPSWAAERAKENGIAYATFTWRMRHGWTLEKASEIKTLNKFEIAKKGA